MKSHNKALELLRKIEQLPHIRTNLAIYLGCVALGRVRKIDGTREVAPEPLDFFMHNGNILSSMTTAISVCAITALSRKTEKGRKAKLMGLALVSGAAVNALVETRTGLSLPIVPTMFADSTPDPIDFVYGMIGAAAGGTMVVSSLPKRDQETANNSISNTKSECGGIDGEGDPAP